MSDTVCALAEEIVSTIMEGEPGQAREMRTVIATAHTEVCEGAYISQPFNVVVGRKSIKG